MCGFGCYGFYSAAGICDWCVRLEVTPTITGGREETLSESEGGQLQKLA